jgi:TPR repeat protein
MKRAAALIFVLAMLPVAMVAHAQLLVSGAAGRVDSSVARLSLAVAGAVGHRGAAHVLASLRVFKSEDPRQQRLGFRRLEREYEEGSAYAAGKLGWAYQRGLGVEPDLDRAVELYTEAASRGMTYWQYLLAHAYEEGYFGLEPDPERAAHWLNMKPKIHLARYECWVANYYSDGTFPEDEAKRAQYAQACRQED